MEPLNPNTEALEKRRLELIQIINDAFDGVSREGGVSLHETVVLDDCGSDEERAAARALDTESRWQDIPPTWFQGGVNASFMDPIGFHYYAPAFMIFNLKQLGPNHDRSLWTNINIRFHFSPGDDGRMDDWIREKFRLFTPVQGRAVRIFLEFYRDWEDGLYAEEAQEALDWYWGQYE